MSAWRRGGAGRRQQGQQIVALGDLQRSAFALDIGRGGLGDRDHHVLAVESRGGPAGVLEAA